MTTRIMAVAAVLAIALALAGCSDDDDADASGTAAAVVSVSMAEGCALLEARLKDGMFTDPERQGELAQMYEDAKAIAPDDIDVHLDVLVDAYTAIADAVEKSEGELSRDLDVNAARAALLRPPVVTAMHTTENYFDAECPRTES